MESDGEGHVEDKWCMETRFTSFDKVNYIKIYIHDGCPEEPVKKGGSKSHTRGRTTVKTTRKPSKKAFFPSKTRKNHEKMHIECQKMTFFKSALMKFHTSHHIYKFAMRKKSLFENIFFLSEISSAAPNGGQYSSVIIIS